MSEDIKIEVTSTESFTPNVPTRVLSMVGIVASEIPAVPVNALGATVDHMKSSPSIKAANARLSSAGSAAITGTTSAVTGLGRLAKKGASFAIAKATSDDAKAARAIAADRLISAIGKAAEIAPIKVVVDGAKDLKDEIVDTWNETGQEVTITTTESIEATSGTDERGDYVIVPIKCPVCEQISKRRFYVDDPDFGADMAMAVEMPCDDCDRLAAQEAIEAAADTLSPEAFDRDPMDPNNL